VVGAVVVAVVVLWAIGRAWGAGAVGNIADWTAAVGTVGTLSVAVWLASREVANRERQQAARVYSWLIWEAVGAGTEAWPSVVRVAVCNASHEPIYDALVTVISPDGTDVDSWPYPVLAPGDDPRPKLTTKHNSLTCSMRFTDASGLGWSRDGDGILRRFRLADRRP
jgi:hypothetical protein